MKAVVAVTLGLVAGFLIDVTAPQATPAAAGTQGRRSGGKGAMSHSLIALVRIGTVPSSQVEALVPTVASAFDRDVFVAGSVDLPPQAFDPERRQYLSTVILEVLTSMRRPGWERVLGIADVDLFASRLNFVFGEADAGSGVAVMSLARLHDRDTTVFHRRAETEAIHELGHTYGLGHCRDPRCVMWFSNTLAESDLKGTRFCEAHARELANARQP